MSLKLSLSLQLASKSMDEATLWFEAPASEMASRLYSEGQPTVVWERNDVRLRIPERRIIGIEQRNVSTGIKTHNSAYLRRWNRDPHERRKILSVSQPTRRWRMPPKLSRHRLSHRSSPMVAASLVSAEKHWMYKIKSSIPRFLDATAHLYKRSCPSVRPSPVIFERRIWLFLRVKTMVQWVTHLMNPRGTFYQGHRVSQTVTNHPAPPQPLTMQ